MLSLHVEKFADDTGGSIWDDSNTSYAEDSEVYNPPDGWEVDFDRGGCKVKSFSGKRCSGIINHRNS